MIILDNFAIPLTPHSHISRSTLRNFRAYILVLSFIPARSARLISDLAAKWRSNTPIDCGRLRETSPNASLVVSRSQKFQSVARALAPFTIRNFHIGSFRERRTVVLFRVELSARTRSTIFVRPVFHSFERSHDSRDHECTYDE